MSLRFLDCELDFDLHELRRGGELVHLTPKAYALLELLARERPRAVGRQQILDAVWPETFVGDGSISVAIAEVRRALGDSGPDGRSVRTVRGFGYAFCAVVTSPATAEPLPSMEPPPTAVCRLVAWGVDQRFLAIGEYLIGRGKECGLQVDVASLSRRHARLTVGEREATLEDLASKNGSFLNGERLAGSFAGAVHEGDEIRLGSVVFSLHWLANAGPTETLPPAGGAGPGDPGA